jgi:hypothetical protein
MTKTPRKIHDDAKREMAAFDALPPEVRDFIRTANQGWECTKLRMRLAKSARSRGGWWNAERLIQQYRAEDAMPAEIEPMKEAA